MDVDGGLLSSAPADPNTYFRFYRCTLGSSVWTCKRTIYPVFVLEDDQTRLCAVNTLVPPPFTRWVLQRQLPSHPVQVQASSQGTW